MCQSWLAESSLCISTNCTFGSCKKSVLWGNLVGQCHVDTEEEEDLESEEVRGDAAPPPPAPSPPRLPLTHFVLTGTLDRLAGDLILCPQPSPLHLFCLSLSFY